jgi:hypothetical protein
MSTPFHAHRQQLQQMYGFDFPEDLFRFWEFAKRLRPLEPLQALGDTPLHVQLVGPFEVLAGCFDDRPPPLSILLHWRYYLDPPEFFTVLAGSIDGLHWGYYLDDPEQGAGCIASYYTNDAFELSTDGDTLFDAVRLDLEEHEAQAHEYHSYGMITDDDLKQQIASLAQLRQALLAFATGEHPETGAAYVDRHAGQAARNERIVAQTQEGMGIAVAPQRYRPLSWPRGRLRKYLWKTEDPVEVVAEARQALQEGFPGTALKLGKDLWCLPGERRSTYASELLDAAYAALGRESLRRVLRVHREHRNLPSVDLRELGI